MATIAAAVIGAAGTATGGVFAAQGAKAAANAANTTATTVPLPGYADALNHYMARLVAGNATRVAPSFTDWVKSGGTATFNMYDPGLTPREAGKLGFVDPRTGQEIPFVDPTTSELTPEQVLYLGQQNTRFARTRYGTQAKDPASRYFRAERRLGNLGERLEGLEAIDPSTLGPRAARKTERKIARTERRIERVEGRKQRLEDLIFNRRGGIEE